MHCRIALVLFVVTTGAWALDPERALSQYAVDRWTAEQGLPLDAVSALAQTADGYLWIGTQAGLARFDGSQFTVYDASNTPAMTSDWIDRLLADRRGGLWVATQKEILRHEAGLFTPVMIDEFAGERAEMIYQDALDRIWVGFDDPGPLRVWRDGRLAVFRDDGGKTLPNVDWIGERGEGEICVVDGDVACFADGVRTPLGVGDAIDASLEGAAFATFADGTLWVVTRRDGLFVLEGAAVRQVGIDEGAPRARVTGIARDRQGATWLRTFDGLMRATDDGFQTLGPRDGFPAGLPLAWLEDHEGSVWVGMQHGLFRLRESLFNVHSVEEGLAAPQAYAVFAAADGTLWVSTPGAGLQRLDGGGWTRFGRKRGVTHDVLSIWQEPDAGALWIGTAGGGARRFENGVFVPHASPEVVLSGASDRDGTTYFGSMSGFVRRRGESYVTEEVPSRQRVTAILRTENRGVWFATFEGSVVRRDGAETAVFGAAQGLSGDPVLALIEDADGTVWGASYGGGIVRLRDGRANRIATDHGLPTNNFYALVEDGDGALWLSSASGIVAVERSDIDRVVAGDVQRVEVRQYGEKDGMRSAECNGGYSPAATRDRRGRLWFPTTDGVVSIDPADRSRASAPPRVLVERLLADGEAVAPRGASAALPTGRRNLEIRYTGISFLAPDEVRFRYRLDRYDSEWTDAGARRTALFTRVPPGNYTFEVQAATGDGEWSEAALLPLRVPPRFYETWTFYALVGALVALSLYGWHRHRLQRALELERVRLRIARDLHDDLGASLSSISFQSEVARRRVATDAAQSADLIAQVGASAREAADAITDIVWAVDPRRDDLGSLAARLRAVAGELFDATETRWRVDAPDDAASVQLTPEVRRQVYLILKESLNNAARHAGAREIDVRIERGPGGLLARVRDDGRGFDPRAAGSGGRGGNGLRNVRERAEAVGGQVTVESTPGAGTTLSVRVPLG